MKLDKVAILVKKAALEFNKIAYAVLEGYDLTPSQFKVMKYLYQESEKGVRIVDLEKFYSMSHPTTIGIIQNLEKKSLVKYQKNPNHARSRFIVPTEDAIRKKKELEDLSEKLEMELTKNLSEKERLELVTLLRKLMGLSVMTETSTGETNGKL